jgi:hypothetical protein
MFASLGEVYVRRIASHVMELTFSSRARDRIGREVGAEVPRMGIR